MLILRANLGNKAFNVDYSMEFDYRRCLFIFLWDELAQSTVL